MRFARWFAAAALFSAMPAQAQVPDGAPKLVVVLSVDQFSSDLFSQWRGKYTGGLKRMASGVVFPGGYQSHAATETCPGHSTITSGIRPGRAGIAANDWFGMRGDRYDEIYCVEDEDIPGSSHDDYTVSLKHLSADWQTLGDRMKSLPGSTTRVFAVSGKDRGATLMAGRKADQTFWYDWRAKGFTTYVGADRSGVSTAVPALAAVNARIAQWIAKPVIPPLPPQCQARIAPVQVGKLTVGDGAEDGPRTDKAENTAKDFRTTRAIDLATLDLAESMVAANGLGRRAGTDVLAIGLSATDYIGHSYGTEGPEMCGQMISLDARLGQFFAMLDRQKIDYVVALTADHGGFDAPERHSEHAYPSASRAPLSLAAPVLSQMLAKQFGWQGALIENRALGGDYWFTPNVPGNRRAEAAAWLKGELERQFAGKVAAVFAKADIAEIPVPTGNPALWSLAQRVRASFVPDRSGDIYIALLNGQQPMPAGIRGYVATHGSPWDYDRRVPILFWRKGMTPFEQPQPVETVDIMPTLASLVGLPIDPSSVDGRCLDLAAGPGTTCR
jgi:predicted AlkP superfamily pyrophosphatase or phosphodiesterase